MGLSLRVSSTRPPESAAVRASRTSWTELTVILVVLSTVLKLALAVENYWNGYRAGDFRGVGIDGWGYVERAAGRVEALGEANWLWDALNLGVLHALGSDTWLYLVMSLVNVALSLLLPFMFVPAIRRLVPVDRRAVATVVTIGVLLFWPPAIWLSGQNLKDTLLTVCVAGYVSAYVVMVDHASGVRSRLTAGALLLLSAWLIVSLRVYAIALIGVGSVVGVIALPGRRLRRVIALGAVTLLALASPPGQELVHMIQFGYAVIMNPEYREIVNSDLALINNAPLGLNLSVGAFVLGAGRAPFNPYPGPNVTTWYDVAMMLRTVIVCLVFPGFLAALARWHHPLRTFFAVTLIVAWLFFALQASLNGSRQVYSTIEPPFVMLAVILVVLNPTARVWRLGAVLGAGLALTLFAYTAYRTAMGA
jgi:hypothetical protein